MNQTTGNKIMSKICVKCGKVKALNAFLPHREWASQSFHDAWCKNCVQSFCVTVDTLKEYCYYNNRRFSRIQYDVAIKKARYALANNAEYIRRQTNPAKKEALEEQATIRQYFTLINLPNYYMYASNISDGGNMPDYDPGREADPPGDDVLVYSKEWNGMYTQRDISYLNDYYGQLEEDFVLDNENIRDYARKVSKASLDADLTYNRMRHGQASVSAWKEAQAIFDNLSKSANFAECKRKPGENTGPGALGLIIQKIEGTGILETTKVTFPEDDIDRILNDFRHTVHAIGLDGVNP
jgi:hypothetical protein